MKKHSLSLLVIGLALAMVTAGALFTAAVLTGRLPTAQTVRAEQGALVELDTAWADRLAAQPTIQQMKRQIEDTTAAAAGLQADGLLLCGLTGEGQAIFRDSTGTLAAARALPKAIGSFPALTRCGIWCRPPPKPGWRSALRRLPPPADRLRRPSPG